MTLSPQNAQAQLGARINWLGRPILFTKSDGSVTVECTYDTMGRRATKKVTTNGTLTEHRGYLQIACCDLTRAYTPALWFILWESLRGLGGGLDNARSGIAPKGRAGNGVPASQPTQPTATRPLAIQKNGTWYSYGWDLTKNICETYRTDARIDLAYTYTPYGECSPAHAYDQPLRWSSEYHDTELGLVYYNYRHYNPAMGRWIMRDILFEKEGLNLFLYNHNNSVKSYDKLGLYSEGIVMHYLFFKDDIDVANYITYGVRLRKYNHLYVAKKETEFIPNEWCEECISKLVVYAHGAIIHNDAYLFAGYDEANALREKNDGSQKEISQFFINANINFCKRAILDIRSCHIGNVASIKTDIENYYLTKGKNVTVRTYPYSVTLNGNENIFVSLIRYLFN